MKIREQHNAGRQTLKIVLHGRRKRGRPTQRWMDCANRDTSAIEPTEDDVHDITGCMTIVSVAATP